MVGMWGEIWGWVGGKGSRSLVLLTQVRRKRKEDACSIEEETKYPLTPLLLPGQPEPH